MHRRWPKEGCFRKRECPFSFASFFHTHSFSSLSWVGPVATKQHMNDNENQFVSSIDRLDYVGFCERMGSLGKEGFVVCKYVFFLISFFH